MIQFATFVNNNARRWERGERDHLACASALLLACGATDAPTNADNLKRLTEQVSGLSNNAAFRSGQLAMQSIVHAAVNDIADSPESLDRHAIIGKLRRRLNSEFDTLSRSASFAETGKVVPSQTSLEKENARLREENAELSRQLAARIPAKVVADGAVTMCTDKLNNLLAYAATRLDRTLAHGIQGGDFATTFRLTHELFDRLISRVNKLQGESEHYGAAMKLQQESHRASMAAVDKHRTELAIMLTYFDLRTGVCSTMAETVDMVRRGVSKMHGELRELRAREQRTDTVWSILDANRATTARLKEELAKITGFDVSSIPDYDPSKPGAVCAAVAEAARTYGHLRYQVGCKDSHSVVDGWLIDMMKGIGCSTEELVDLVAETKREGNGDKAFEVAKTIILRRMLNMLATIAQRAMPVSLPRPWHPGWPGALAPGAVEGAASQLVQEIQERTSQRLTLDESKLRRSPL